MMNARQDSIVYSGFIFVYVWLLSYTMYRANLKTYVLGSDSRAYNYRSLLFSLFKLIVWELSSRLCFMNISESIWFSIR